MRLGLPEHEAETTYVIGVSAPSFATHVSEIVPPSVTNTRCPAGSNSTPRGLSATNLS